MVYCETSDMKHGNVPIASYIDPQEYVNDAADEIDSYIGTVYVTPVPVTEESTTSRPARLLLKRINAHLATGRMLQALDAAGQDDRLHAYATSLIRESLAALRAIAGMELILEGANRIESQTELVTAPIIANKDPESNVESFYDRIAMSGSVGGLAEPFPPVYRYPRRS